MTLINNPPANAGDTDVGSIPWSGRSLGVGNGNSLQYSCLGSSMDREAWQAIVHGRAKNRNNRADEHTLKIHYLNCTCFIVIFILWLLDLKLPMWLTLYFCRTALICTVVPHTPAGIFVNRLRQLPHPCPSYADTWFGLLVVVSIINVHSNFFFFFPLWACSGRWICAGFSHSSGPHVAQHCSFLTMRRQLHFLVAPLHLPRWIMFQIRRLDPALTNGLSSNQVTQTRIRQINERGRDKAAIAIAAQKTVEEMSIAQSSKSVRKRDTSIYIQMKCTSASLHSLKRQICILRKDQFHGFLVFFEMYNNMISDLLFNFCLEWQKS